MSRRKCWNDRLDAKVAFPTEHVRRVIEAAEAGKTLLELSVFDGSESGDKVFSTLAAAALRRGARQRIRPPAIHA